MRDVGSSPRLGVWDGSIARAAVGAVLASLVGVAAGAGVTLADSAIGWRLPGTIALAQTMTGSMLSAIVTLAVFAIWMRSVVVGLASSNIPSRIVVGYLNDGFQWRLLLGMCAAIAMTATLLLGLREDLGDGVPALSVATALAVVVGGLVAVLAALHQGVRQLAPPSILHRIATHARDLIASERGPDDDRLAALPEVCSEADATVVSTRMGWVGAVDHDAVLEALPSATGLRLLVDTGAFVDRGEAIAVADRALPSATGEAIRAAIEVTAWRSLEADVGLALQQLRDLALVGMQDQGSDSATVHDALLYLGVVLRDLVTSPEPPGVLVGTDDRVLVSIGRQRTGANLDDVLEPLVLAAGQHAIASAQLLRVVRSLHAAADGPTSAASEPLRARLASLVARLEGGRDGGVSTDGFSDDGRGAHSDRSWAGSPADPR